MHLIRLAAEPDNPPSPTWGREKKGSCISFSAPDLPDRWASAGQAGKVSARTDEVYSQIFSHIKTLLWLLILK
jgi:hypothetical protein